MTDAVQDKSQVVRNVINPDKIDGPVVIIGQGGIGAILTRYLSVMLASLKPDAEVLLVDGDHYEEANRYRMAIPEFAKKAEANCKELSALLPNGPWLEPVTEYVKPDNIEEIVPEGSHVFLCVDNHKTRKLVNDHCKALGDVLLVSGGNDGVDAEAGERGTYGNVQVYRRHHASPEFSGNPDITEPLDKFHPEIANPADKSPHEEDCLELMAGGAAAQLLPANLAVASAMLNAYVRYLWSEEPPMYDEVCLDILDNRMAPQYRSCSEGGV